VRLHPEVVLLGDHTMSCVRWTLDQETERIETLEAENPAMRAAMVENGWNARAIAWGHVIDGLLKLADFDDERGRT